jgi:hypothetical protein
MHRIGVVFHKSDKIQRALDKYKSRGWAIVKDTTETQPRVFGDISRHIDDSESWVITLPSIPDGKYDAFVRGLSPAATVQPLSQDPVCVSSWAFTNYSNLFGSPCGLQFYIVGGRSLKYNYVIEDRTKLGSWDISRKLDLMRFGRNSSTARRQDEL